MVRSSVNASQFDKATFAGGCFWCMEPPFEETKGVTKVISGYTGGAGENPTYKDYAAKGHIEAIEVTYDPSVISYSELIGIFWRQIDPTDNAGQFCDRGPQYRPAIFYHNEEQKQAAQNSKDELARSGLLNKPILTEIMPASNFYPAEEYHQDYHKKNAIAYKFYRFGCGRDKTLEKIWRTSTETKNKQQKTERYTKEELKKKLSPLQYRVTQENGTERAFDNPYWDNKKDGIYVDIVSGEPLFASQDKFESHTGWPSFTKPLEPENIVEKEDRGLFQTLTEVRSRHADSHLGHVFKDGPAPARLRYCINSAALRFIPKEELEKEGYSQYRKLFEK